MGLGSDAELKEDQQEMRVPQGHLRCLRYSTGFSPSPPSCVEPESEGTYLETTHF